MSTRPRAATATAILLVLAGGGVTLLGLLATWASSCCGARDGGDGTPSVVGLLAGGALVAAGAVLWAGHTRGLVPLALAGGVPVSCLVASSHSSDLGAAAVPAALAWVILWEVLRRADVTDWLARARPAR